MISNKEMKYVNTKQELNQELPYPGDNYSLDAILELENAFYLYENYYRDREYEVTFSNGQNLEFSIPQHNLAHIVGLNYKWLTENNIPKELGVSDAPIPSYDLIQAVISNKKDILKLNKESNYQLINFYRLKVRSEVFSKFSNFNEFNFGCMFFDKEIGKENGYITNMKTDRYLFTESNDPSFEHYMMGIVSGENGENQYIESLFPNRLTKEMFANQEIAMPTLISTTTPNEYDKKEATAYQKLKLIKSFNELEKKYNANFSYLNDYCATLAEQARIDERQKVLKI